MQTFKSDIKMKKRLFLAQPLDEESKEVFRLFRDTMKMEAGGVRWVPEKNLHLTVLFLGELAEELLPVIAMELEKLSLESAAFDLEFDCYEIKFRRSRPAMIWARYREKEAYSSLANRAHRLLSEWIPLSRPRPRQIPHVTLARIRSKKWNRAFPADMPRPQKLRVNELLLFESVTGAADPVYIPLQRFPLLH